MALSTFTGIVLIPERSEATPGLWNNIFSTISANLDTLNSDKSVLAASIGTTTSSVGFSSNTLRPETSNLTITVLAASGGASVAFVAPLSTNTIRTDSGNTLLLFPSVDSLLGTLSVATIQSSGNTLAFLAAISTNTIIAQSGLTVSLSTALVVPNINAVRYAAQFAGADAGAKINNAIADLPAGGGLVDCAGLEGVQTSSSVITVLVSTRLNLSSMTLVLSTNPGVAINVGVIGTSGRLYGRGDSLSIISYNGTGDAVLIGGGGAGFSQAKPEVADLKIIGTSAASSGIHLKPMNEAVLRGLSIRSFSGGDGITNEGANTVTYLYCDIGSCKIGLHHSSMSTGGKAYSANACQFLGGQLINNTNFGAWEDVGPNGPNIGNTYIGAVFETNGTSSITSTGQLFIQLGTAIGVQNCYFESTSVSSLSYQIIIGDGVNAPVGTNITANTFASINGTSTIRNVNGQNVTIVGNQENAAVVNFVENLTAERNLWLGPNRAAAATNYLSGTDSGTDTFIFNSTAINTFLNGMGTTIRGLGFNQISGLNQDLVIRTRGGGTNLATFQNIDGTALGSIVNTTGIRFIDGTALLPSYAFSSENSLGWYRSSKSGMGLSYGQLEVPAGTALAPSYAISSESSLGVYRSAASTLAMSYGTLQLTSGGLTLATAGDRIRIKNGTNASFGTAVMSVGSVNVATNIVTANSVIFLTDQTAGGTLGDIGLGGIRAGSGFTIQSTSVTDTSTVAWLIIEPSP